MCVIYKMISSMHTACIIAVVYKLCFAHNAIMVNSVM